MADARRAADLEATAAELDSPRLIAIPGDVTDPAHRAALVVAAIDAGPLRLLVNNASRLGPSPQPALADYLAADLRAVYNVNVFAPLALIQAALPALTDNHGVIVNLTSDAAVEAYEGWGGYGSSKAALDHLSAILAAENPAVPRLRVRSRRHAHRDAPGRVPRRGHLRPRRTGVRRAGAAAAARHQAGGRPLPRRAIWLAVGAGA